MAAKFETGATVAQNRRASFDYFIEDKVEDLNELQANTIAKQILAETGEIVPIDIGVGN